MYTYDRFAQYYDLEYGHKDDDIPFYLEIASKYGSPILEIGVGTGRIAMPLIQAGYHVVGIDSSIQMLRIGKAKQKQLNTSIQKYLHLIAADMRLFSLNQLFPVCIVPFRTFLHNLTQQDQIRTLNCIKNSLAQNGILVIDLFVPLYEILIKSGWEDTIPEEEFEGKKISVYIKVDHDPVMQLLKIKNTYNEILANGKSRQTQSYMTYRYIFRYEMEILLKLTGFEILEIYSFFNNIPYNYYSGEMIFIAQRQ